MLRLRNSPMNEASSGTALRTEPPEMTPTLMVVSSSRRPWRSSVIISAAMRMAESPFLRLDAGVCGAAGDVHGEDDVGGAGTGHLAGRAVTVEDHAALGLDHRYVKIARADQAKLLFAGEYELYGDPLRAVLVKRLQRFQYGGDTGLAIAAEDGGAVGDDAVVQYLRLYASARLDGVHVRRYQQWVVAFLRGYQIAVGVSFYAEPEAAETPREFLGDLFLFSGRAVYPHKVAECSYQAVLIYHDILAGLGRGDYTRKRTGVMVDYLT